MQAPAPMCVIVAPASPGYLVSSRSSARTPLRRVALNHKRQWSGYSAASTRTGYSATSTRTPLGSTSVASSHSNEAEAPVHAALAPQLVLKGRSRSVPAMRRSAEPFQAGANVLIAQRSFLCTKALGKGSFGEVWEGMDNGARVAMKDVVCRRQAELEQAMLEVSLLKSLHRAGVCIPECFGHDVHHRQDGTSVVRFAMTRIPGEPLEDFLSKPCLVKPAPAALQLGLGIVAQLVTQLGRSLDAINQHVWHRDVNPRNVLISDAQSGESFDSVKGDIENVRFGLIDFGLAVDSGSWHSKWPSSSIAGDCRYWPASSWVMSFHGSQALRQQPQLLRQYETKLDSYALGVLALELLCGSLSQCNTSELSTSCQMLLTAFAAFHSDMFRWNMEVHSVFSSGGNPQCLRQKYQQEGVAAKVQRHAAAVARHLRDFAQVCLEPRSRNLLCVIAELLDERSTLTVQGAVEAANADELSPLVDDCHQRQEVTRRISAFQVSQQRRPSQTFVLPHMAMVAISNSPPMAYRVLTAR